MQGLELPTPSICSSSSLPPSATRPSLPPPLPPLSHQHLFVEPEDTTGQARMKRVRPIPTSSTPSTSSVSTANPPSVSCTPPAVREEIQTSSTPAMTEEIVVHDTMTSASEHISRTQKWRLLKANQGKCGHGAPAPKRSRRIYHCGECGQVRGELHINTYICIYTVYL